MYAGLLLLLPFYDSGSIHTTGKNIRPSLFDLLTDIKSRIILLPRVQEELEFYLEILEASQIVSQEFLVQETRRGTISRLYPENISTSSRITL